jgi:hypothetical protein
VRPSTGLRVQLVYERGVVDRPPFLTYGYRGTGVDNLRGFLLESGFDSGALEGIADGSWSGVSR